jgi:hypothetical protein
MEVLVMLIYAHILHKNVKNIGLMVKKLHYR